MNISYKSNSTDSRTVKALVEQVSNLQEDLGIVKQDVDNLELSQLTEKDLAAGVDEIKANKVNVTEFAAVGDATIGTVHSQEVDAVYVHTPKVTSNYADINAAYIDTLKAGAETVTSLSVTGKAKEGEAKFFNAEDGYIKDLKADQIEVPAVKATQITAGRIDGVAALEAKNIKATKVDTTNEKVSNKLEVKDIDITGNITGLNHVTLDADKITSRDLQAEIFKNSISYIDGTQYLNPSPVVDDNDLYTIELPVFTGQVFLEWKDGNTTVWSAVVTGNGTDYNIAWGSADDIIHIFGLYQYEKKLFIRINTHGTLYFGYKVTKEIEPIKIHYMADGLPSNYDEDIDTRHKYKPTGASGFITFGDVVMPSFIQEFGTLVDDFEVKNKLKVDASKFILGNQWVKVCNDFTTDWIE